MPRFENIILNLQNKTKSQKILLSSLETFATLIVWLLTLYLSALFILSPVSQLHIPNFKREINFAIYLIAIGFLIPFSFLILWRGFIIGLKPISIFNFGTNFRLKLFALGFFISALILTASSLIAKENMFEMIISRFSGFSIIQIISLLIVYLFAFLIQTTFEEALFRATIIQNLKAFGTNIIIAIFTSAMIFAFFHLSKKTEPALFFGVFIMGICFSIATYRTNGIEAAIGAHLANNFITGAIFGNFDNSQNMQNIIILSAIFFILYLGLLEAFLWFFRTYLRIDLLR